MLLVYCQTQGKGREKRGAERERKRTKHMPENQMSVCCSVKSQERGSGAAMEGNRILFVE